MDDKTPMLWVEVAKKSSSALMLKKVRFPIFALGHVFNQKYAGLSERFKASQKVRIC